MSSVLQERVPMSSGWVSRHNERNMTKEWCVDGGCLCRSLSERKGCLFVHVFGTVPMSSGLQEMVPMSSDWVSRHNERNMAKEWVR
jgi:hypothetical protein